MKVAVTILYTQMLGAALFSIACFFSFLCFLGCGEVVLSHAAVFLFMWFLE
jgi:hypothetical protein